MPDVYTFNVWLSAAAQLGDTKAAENIMLVMQEEFQIKPDIVSFSTVIGACAEAKDVEGARQWLFKAEDEGLEPDLKCYNQAIKACARAANASQAEHLARRLMRNRLTPDMYTYNTMLSAFAKDGSPSAAEYWVDRMQRQARHNHGEFPADQIAIAYGEVLLAHARAGNLEAAEAWLSQMLGEGIEPDGRCYLVLARTHLEQGRTEEARRWLDRMATWSGLRPPRNLLKEVERARPQMLGEEQGREPVPVMAE